MKPLTKKRVEWIDIFKGLAIVLMVIGHTTGLFNIMIYQFHMAAFFFITGYCSSSIKTKTFLKEIFDKFVSLILPLTSVFLIFIYGILKLWAHIGCHI